MSELRSALELLRSETLADLPDPQIEEEFTELEQVAALVEAERLRRLAEIDRRGIYRHNGHLSTASWLTSGFKVAWGAARQRVRTARALEEMPETRRALESGDLPLSAVRVLVEARDVEPETFRNSEAHLVDAAQTHSVHVFRRIVAYWRQAAEREAVMGGEEKLRQQRRLHASVTFLGMVRVDGNLDPETGETLLSALQATLDAESRSGPEGDSRTAAQRRADALGEICRQWLDNADRPRVAGERPHVNLTVDAGAVAGREPSAGERNGTSGAISELDHVGPIEPAVARRVLCDAAIRRIVMAGRSEPLDVGRQTPVVSPAMRRAVIARDRNCRFPGCDRPHTWCDAHHVVHWADGGPTAVPNLILLCRRHHRMVHERNGFRLELVEGRPVFTRPDGSVLPAPP